MTELFADENQSSMVKCCIKIFAMSYYRQSDCKKGYDFTCSCFVVNTIFQHHQYYISVSESLDHCLQF